MAQAIKSTAEAGAEWSSENYPEETQKVAQVLSAVGDKVAAGVKVVWTDTETGQKVTRYWNEIPQEHRDAILGGTAVVSMIVPAGVVAKFKALGKLDIEAGDWIKDPGHKNWDSVSDADRNLIDQHFELETKIPILDLGVDDFSTVNSQIKLEQLHTLNPQQVGEIGEEVAKQFLRNNGYDVDNSIVIKNASDNGIDIIARSPDGTPTFFEVKSTKTGIVGKLSGLQSDSNSFVRGLLDEGGLNGTIRRQNITPELQIEIMDLRDQVLSSDSPIRAAAIGVDLLNREIKVSKW